jgi:hypothetical protein
MQVGDSVNDRLECLGKDRDAEVVAPPIDWYGIDPIHIRKRSRAAAWEELLNLAHKQDSNAQQLDNSAPVQLPEPELEEVYQRPDDRDGGTLTIDRKETASVTDSASIQRTFELKNPWLGKRIRIWRHKPFRMWRKNVERVTDQPSVVIGNSELWLF